MFRSWRMAGGRRSARPSGETRFRVRPKVSFGIGTRWLRRHHRSRRAEFALALLLDADSSIYGLMNVITGARRVLPAWRLLRQPMRNAGCPSRPLLPPSCLRWRGLPSRNYHPARLSTLHRLILGTWGISLALKQVVIIALGRPPRARQPNPVRPDPWRYLSGLPPLHHGITITCRRDISFLLPHFLSAS